MVTSLEGRGMDEQRYVVEITRPVPPEKVGQVAQRIAERLNVPVERIVTLLDGRVGEVTKPVLAEKADAIVEVFAEAGVRVIVVAARVDPPPYQEQFGVSPEDAAPVDEPPVDEYPVDEFPEDEFPVDEFPEDQDDDPDDDVPWGQEVTWGFDSAAAQEWTRPSGEEDAEYEPYEVQDEPSDESSDEPPEVQEDSYDGPYDDPSYAAPDAWPPVNPEPRPTAHVPEEEADRLGPTPRPLRVAYEYPADTLRESQPPESEKGNAAPGIST